MPFADEFDDVYSTIKTGVEGAMSQDCRCFRLDESRPAGRITDRLLLELRTASFCIADLTGNRPNVMWELGYAMALGLPTIIVTQRIDELPFDIRDMQSIQYDRNRLNATLGSPLRTMVIDTLSMNPDSSKDINNDKEFVGQVLSDLGDLKGMIAQAVRAWNPPTQAPKEEPASINTLRTLEGAWITRESGSHAYAKVLEGDLIVPYCYGKDTELTGVYHAWRRTGEYWFARFAWLNGDFSGFAFLKQESVDVLRGAWWHEQELPDTHGVPPDKYGVTATWGRVAVKEYPTWASRFLEEVASVGLAARLTRR